jgi:glycosyltransferase involved in cell wall biosynthesis
MKIGIALAVYQPQSEFFEKQLQSLLDQTYQDWFCVITADSSLNEIFKNEKINPFKNHPKFRWHENTAQLGVTKNFEKAIQLCLKENAEVVACADQDDVWYPQKIARSVEVFQQYPPLRLVHTDMHLLYQNEKGEEVIGKETGWQAERRGVQHVQPKHFLIRNVVAGCSMLFDADLARKYSEIPKEFYHPDYWYPFLASVYGKVYSIAEPTYAYRQHKENALGISPFKGFFYTNPQSGLMDNLKKFRRVYLKSRDLVSAAVREKISIPFFSKFPITSFDLGFSLFLMGLYYLCSPFERDVPLARACFARALGKALFFIPGSKI